jgi:hypothetical protein
MDRCCDGFRSLPQVLGLKQYQRLLAVAVAVAASTGYSLAAVAFGVVDAFALLLLLPATGLYVVVALTVDILSGFY